METLDDDEIYEQIQHDPQNRLFDSPYRDARNLVDLTELNVDSPPWHQDRVYDSQGNRIITRTHDMITPLSRARCGPLFNLKAAASLCSSSEPVETVNVTRGLDPRRSRRAVITEDTLHDEPEINPIYTLWLSCQTPVISNATALLHLSLRSWSR
jgi:hypothetical protein